MALIHCNFWSEVLGLCCSLDAIIPEPRFSLDSKFTSRKRYFPALYLLHGLTDDHTIWQRRTSIERYAAEYEVVVIMPAVGRSYYTDMAQGYRYWTFISKELPVITRNLLPLSSRREDNFVAGLSMGGYGAFKIALSCPEKFSAAASLSGVLDVAGLAQESVRQQEMRLIFGNIKNIPGSINDLFYLCDNLDPKYKRDLKLYQWCGTEDFLYEKNQKFKAHAENIGLDLTYEEGPGEHEWNAWDLMIQRILAWLPLPKA